MSHVAKRHIIIYSNNLISLLFLSMFADVLICFLMGGAPNAKQRHSAYKPIYSFHFETHGIHKDRTLTYQLAHEHASHSADTLPVPRGSR